MQHGLAKPKREDPDESLSVKGRNEVKDLGEKLAKLQVSFQTAIVSPKKRSQETALILLDKLKASRDIIKQTQAIKAKADTQETIEYLKSLGDVSSVLIVGHLPSLELLVKALCGAHIVFQNGACILLDVDLLYANTAKIVWYLPPNL